VLFHADPTQINTERAQAMKSMNTNMQGHNHGGKSHLLWMLGIGGAVLVVQLGLGRSFSQSLPLAFFVACPLMMIGMMFMMGNGNAQQQGNDANDRHDDSDQGDHGDHGDHGDVTDQRGNEAPAPWQDSPNMTPARPHDTTDTTDITDITGPDGPRRTRG